MKALIGVDGSSNSLAAVEFVGRLLSSDRDELILLYAAPEISFGGEELLDATVQHRARNALSRAVFDEALARLPDAWQNHVEPVEAPGSPGATLLSAADERGVDLIAVGFRGTSLFEEFMLGSVSRAVVHSANVPVLVVKSLPVTDDSRLEKPSGGGDKRLRVLVAYDGPVVGKRMAEVLGRIDWPDITEALVVNVVQPMFVTELPDWLRQRTRNPDVAAMADAWRKEHEQNVQAARHELVEFQTTLPPEFAKKLPLVVEGRPGEKLLAELSKQPYDLAVVGSRGRGNVARLLLGSTSSEVLAAAPCSVLIVR
jgi:nucleotide-binding universal stress UspA family protein